MTAHTSPPWPRNVKTIAAVAGIVLGALLLWRFAEFVQLFALAALMAFILHPILAFLQRWVRLPRGVAVLITYLLFALVLGVTALLVSALAQNQIGGLINNALETVRGLITFAERFLSSLANASFQIGRFRVQMPANQINEALPQFYESLVALPRADARKPDQ